MRIFAIGDLHLSFANPKEMDIFGSHWKNHFDKISEDWKKRVLEEDIVLIPGDISWAMKMEDAKVDLDAILALPGKKILLRGNHDYWWGSLAKVKSMVDENCYILQNNSFKVGDYIFCGTRGWTFPQDKAFSEQDRKIYERELIRLRLSLDSAKKHGEGRLIVMMHYPPLYEDVPNTGFAEIIDEYPVSDVVFGHLHGSILRQINLRDFMLSGVKYNLVSADYLNFNLKQIV